MVHLRGEPVASRAVLYTPFDALPKADHAKAIAIPTVSESLLH